jgi:hypothetical protein
MVSGLDVGTVAKFAARVARLCALIVAAAVWMAPPAAAAAPAPAWSIVVSAYPTHFANGMTGGKDKLPGYLLLVTNSGGGATSGEFMITDSLPARLSFATAAGAAGTYGGQQTGLACSVAIRTVTCSGGEPSLQPGETAQVIVPVNVAPGSPSAVLNKAAVSGGGAAPVVTSTKTPIASEPPPFDFLPDPVGLGGGISEADGSDATLAGSHPYEFRAGINFPTQMSGKELLAVGGGVRDLSFALPPGLVVNPGAVPERCTESELVGAGCPAAAQVGTVALLVSALNRAPSVETTALYVMAPPPGVAVEFGLAVTEGASLHLLGRLRNDGSYGLSADINDILAKVPILGADVTLWGEPSDPSHDSLRGNCIYSGGICPVERTNAALLTLPGSCGEPLRTTASADSWLEPGIFATGDIESPAVSGCNSLAFAPILTARPTTAVSDSPTGLGIDLQLPQSVDFDGRAEAAVRDAQVRLPEGMTVNPAVATGLAGCAAGQVGLTTAAGQTPIGFTSSPAACPDDAKIGSAEIDTPILDRPLTGGVYLARPGENPFGTLLALYVAIDDPATGIVVKLPARIDADSRTGRLTLHLDDLPQLPIENVRLSLFQGSRSVLKTPIGCGTHTTTSELTPWSSPEGQNATPADSFRTSVAVAGGACPAGEADAPNRPAFSAGALVPRAGVHSPFVLRVSRGDGSQRLSAIDAVLPAGVTARLAGVPTCSDAEVAAARCPAASQVGSVSVAAGAGPSPLLLTGRAYLAGPYEGAPLSLAVVVPALAGPFDLGTVAVRVALYVDPRSAQVHAVSDPLPTILRGIPLDIRSLAVDLDRPGFALNPTSCEPASVTTTVTSTVGLGARLADRFQVGGCSTLGFRPKVSVRLLGPTHRGAHPGLRTVLTPRPGDANVRAAAITLPGTELLDNRHIGTVCSAGQFAAAQCPAGAIYGQARAWTPMLDQPLEGPVYLRASKTRLPDLVASLGGQVHLDLSARVDSVRGRLRIALGALPDAPLSRVVLTTVGGRRGLLVNTGGLCARKPRVGAAFAGQNSKLHDVSPILRTDCGGR